MNAEILYYLNLLEFLSNEAIDHQKIEEIMAYLSSNRSFEEAMPLQILTQNVIEECNDQILKLAYVRDCKNIKINDKTIEFNKKKFKFNNVFEASDQNDDIIFEMLGFISKRVQLQKNSCVILFGLSGSGKTTLLLKLIEHMQKDACKYKLYEIYNNKLYVFLNGMKTEVFHKELENDKYYFQSNNLENILTKFARKASNGVNVNSSRSHQILEILINGVTVQILDLAGSEKAINTNQIESKYINNSLFNVSRYLKNPKHIDNKCILLNVLKKSSNLILTTLLHDNAQNFASNMLLIFKEILQGLF